MDDVAKIKQQLYRKNSNYKKDIRYHRTRKGLLVGIYQNILSRIRNCKNPNIKEIMINGLITKEAFYEYAFSNETFNRLYDLWVASDFNEYKTPCLTRAVLSEGFYISNFSWSPRSECAFNRRWHFTKV